MHNLSVKLTDEDYAQLVSSTKKAGTSQSEIMRQALRMYFNKVNNKQNSFTKAASDICGSVIGPEELATNPKYMKGYGT